MTTLQILIKRAAVTLLLVIASGTTFAGELEINLTDINKPTGQILLALYDSEDAYNNDIPYDVANVDVYQETVTINFNDLPDGTYAIKLIHDLNNNGQMDFNAMGLPQDGYGFSNNVGQYGMPPFNAAAFDIVNSASINVLVRGPVSL